MNSNKYREIAKRNERYAHTFRFLNNVSFSLPIWILFFNRDLGFSLAVSIFLGSSRWIVSSLCELPTGSWADRFGRLKLLRIGMVGSVVTLIPFVLTKNLYILFLAQIVGGVFAAMTTGVLDPLVKDSFVRAKKLDKFYKKYLSTNNAFLYTSRLISGVIGAWVYVKFPFGPYILDIMAGVLAFLVTFGLTEVWVKRSEANSNYQQISEALKYSYKHKYLRNFLIIVIIYTFVSESIWTSLQPIFDFRSIQPEYFGVLFGLVAGASALGSYLYRLVPEKIDSMTIRLYMTLGILLGALFMQISAVWGVILFAIVIGLSFGWASVNAGLTIQKHVEPHHQSTMLSFYSFLGTIFYSLGSLMVGLYVGLFSVQTLIFILLGQTIVAVGLVSLIASFSVKFTPIGRREKQ